MRWRFSLFGCVKANSNCFNSSNVRDSGWTPGNLQIWRKASPSKSFDHIRSWSKTIRWTMLPMDWHSFSVNRLKEEVLREYGRSFHYNSNLSLNWGLSVFLTMEVCCFSRWEKTYFGRMWTSTNGSLRIREGRWKDYLSVDRVTWDHWNHTVWDFYSKELRINRWIFFNEKRTYFPRRASLLSNDNTLDNRFDRDPNDWCYSLDLVRKVSPTRKSHVAASLPNNGVYLIVEMNQCTCVHRMILEEFLH